MSTGTTGFPDGGAAPDPLTRHAEAIAGGAAPDPGWLDQLADASLSAMKAKYPDGGGAAAPDPRGGIPSEPDPADVPEGQAGPNGAGSVQDGPGAAGSASGDPGATQDGPAEYRERACATVQAWRVTEANAERVAGWCSGSYRPARDGARARVHTWIGSPPAFPGDWVVRNMLGAFRVDPAAWFAATYERVDPDADLTEDGWPL